MNALKHSQHSLLQIGGQTRGQTKQQIHQESDEHLINSKHENIIGKNLKIKAKENQDLKDLLLKVHTI